METVKIPQGVQVTLNVAISSDAIVGAAIRLKGEVTTYPDNQFSVILGDLSTLQNEKMTVQSLFHVDQNIDQIMATTRLDIEVSYGDQTLKLTVKKRKIYNQLFIAFAYVQFTKQ